MQKKWMALRTNGDLSTRQVYLQTDKELLERVIVVMMNIQEIFWLNSIW